MGEKAQRIADGMQAVSQGDIERFGEILLADDVTWHWSGQSPVSGDYEGRDAVMGLVRGFYQGSSESLKVQPLEVLEGEDHAMTFTRVTIDEEGAELDVIMADAMRFGPDGRVVEYWTLSNDQQAVDARISSFGS